MGRIWIIAIIALVISSVIISGCTDSKVKTSEDTITVSGAFALYPLMISWSEEYKKINPDVKIDISAGGAGKGMTDAISGMVDLGMVSREIYPEEEEKGAVWVSVAKDAVVGTINVKNPIISEIKHRGFNTSTLKTLYIEAGYTTWGDLYQDIESESPVNVYTRSDACGAASVWAQFIGFEQEDLQGTGVSGDPGVAEAVRADNQGVGYNNINFAYDVNTGYPIDGLAIIPLDLNNNGIIDPDEDFYNTREELIAAISDGRYPSPPARDLNLVTLSEFKGTTKDFVEWILISGQDYNRENGYLPISGEQLVLEKSKLG